MERCPGKLVVEWIRGCRYNYSPQNTREVLLGSINSSFNEFICVDHSFLDQIGLLLFMYSVTRLRARKIDPCTDLSDADLTIESSC